jgi:hypothetical protein
MLDEYLPRLTGEVPPKGAEGEGHGYALEHFRSGILLGLAWGSPPPAFGCLPR